MENDLTKKQSVWLSFDLGVRGDYEGFYKWLDSKSAIECGDNFAFLQLEHSGDIAEELKHEIEANVEITPKSRVYIIYRSDDHETKLKGKFIFGNRKAAPWVGYAVHEEQVEEEA